MSRLDKINIENKNTEVWISKIRIKKDGLIN